MNDGPGRPFGSAYDAALRQITAPKRSREEYVDSEVWCDAIAEPGSRRKLRPLRTVATKNPCVKTKLTLRIDLSRIAEDWAVVSGNRCARHQYGTGQNN